MTGAACIKLQHFQVARLAAPAVVLLRQLETRDSPVPVLPMDLLLQNPALLVRALDALHRIHPGNAGTSLSARLDALESEDLQSLIQRSALQLVLQDPPPQHVLLLHHWQLSRGISLLVAALARHCAYADTHTAAACGLLLRVGMLVMEQQFGARYAELTETCVSQELLLEAEQELLQTNHIDTGVRLLETWQLDQFCVDALRYQAQALSQLRDASLLTRICWFANQIATAGFDVTPALLDQGQQLLGLGQDTFSTIVSSVQQQLEGEYSPAAATLILEESTTGTRVVTADNNRKGDLLQEQQNLQLDMQQKMHELRQLIITRHMLARHAQPLADASALEPLLCSVLQEAGIDPVFIVFCSARGSTTLQVLASNRVIPDPGGLSLVCIKGRSALANAILEYDISAMSVEAKGLTVVDRQILSLLGGNSVLCESVLFDNNRSVLLLGLTAPAITAYLAQATLRHFIRGKLTQALQKPQTAVPASTLLYQQRVREAVHEANNPLTIIKNYLQILSIKQGNDSQAAEEIRHIKTEIDRVSGILADLRESEDRTGDVAVHDLNAVATGLHRVFASAFGRNHDIQVKLDLTAESARVRGNENALKQIIINLVKNAAEAIDSRGLITISTRVNVYQHEQLFVQLGVADNGSGIPPELMRKLFKPGASTKGGPHQGSGLVIVRRLVDDMSGHISCQSDSKGTAVTILLPQAQ